MSKFLHDTDNDDPDDDNTKAIAIPRVFSLNSRAKKRTNRQKTKSCKLHLQQGITKTLIIYVQIYQPNSLISLFLSLVEQSLAQQTWDLDPYSQTPVKNILSFSPRFCQSESNTTSDWLNHTVCYIQILLNTEDGHRMRVPTPGCRCYLSRIWI